MSLSDKEKKDLMTIVEGMFGSGNQLHIYEKSFNDKTIKVVESIIEETAKCNQNLKALIFSVIGGLSFAHSGWLKKALAELAAYIRADKFKVQGAMCGASSARNFSREIALSTI